MTGEEKTKPQPPSYRVSFAREVDLASPDAITKLQDEFGKDSKIKVLVQAGTVVQKTHKAALTALAQKKELEGEVEVCTESSVKRFKVKTETKREVVIE